MTPPQEPNDVPTGAPNDAPSDVPAQASTGAPTEAADPLSIDRAARGGPRMAPAEPPYPPEVQAWFDRTMPPGVPPLALFTTMARDPRLFQRMMSGGLLDRGHLTLRQRELVIARVTAQCGSEYEWGTHVALFGAKVGLTEAQLRSLVHGGAQDGCWDAGEQTLIDVCDQLHARCDLDDEGWQRARELVGEAGVLEVVMVAGFYRTVSYLTAVTRIPLERFAARFPPK